VVEARKLLDTNQASGRCFSTSCFVIQKLKTKELPDEVEWHSGMDQGYGQRWLLTFTYILDMLIHPVHDV
jgi:hypothetical protein